MQGDPRARILTHGKRGGIPRHSAMQLNFVSSYVNKYRINPIEQISSVYIRVMSWLSG